MRDWMTRHRLRSFQRAGVEVSSTDIERQVVADCELADAARRAGDIDGPARPSEPGPAKPRADVLGKAQEETGARLVEGGQYERFKLLHGNPVAVSPKWANACARIKRILETVNTNTSDLAAAVEGAELRTLAKEAAEVMSWGHMRHSLSPRNPFRGLSGRDFTRKYERLIYDICDRSTGKLGFWYVK